MTFDVVNTTILVIVLLIVLYPLYYVLIASFSNPDFVLTGKIFLLPKGFQTESYAVSYTHLRAHETSV